MSVKELLVRGPLQNVSLAYRNRAYVADRVAPILEGVTAKSQILRHLKGSAFRDEAQIRAPGTRAVRGTAAYDFIDLTPREYAYAAEVTDEDRRHAKQLGAPPLRPDEEAIERVADKIDLNKEIRTAGVVLDGTWSGVAGEDAEGGWATAGDNCTFILDVEARIETIRANTGLRPNVLLLTANTLAKVKQAATVLSRIQYVERGIVSAPLLAALFDLDEVLIADAIKSTAKETKAGTEFTAVNVWEKNATKGSAFLFHRASRPGLKTATALYQARERYDEGGARRVTTWRENAEHQDVYEVAESTDIVQVGADLGFLWYDTILT